MKLNINHLSHEGRGIAKVEGKTVFVDGALPGETVEVQITRKKKRFDEACVLSVLEASKERAAPECPYVERCGGCSLQHMRPSAQLDYKQAVLLEQLLHIGGVEPLEVSEPLISHNLHYRRKARLGVRYVGKKNKLLVGFREKNGRYLTDMDHCAILDERVGFKIKPLSDLIATLEAYNDIPQIEVAAGDNAVGLIIRHLVELSEFDRQKLVAFAKEHGFWIYLQPKGLDSVHLLYPEHEGSQGLFYDLKTFDLRLFFSPGDFIQVHADMNQQMVSQAIDWLSPQKNEVILDLFCGLGNFSLPLATRCKHVIGVEGSEEMVKRAYFNAEKNHIQPVEFYAMDLDEPIESAAWVRPVDKLLLDPPRVGALNVIKHINLFNPTQILYVSCNSATLARDAGELKQRGYLLKKVGIMDMFPHTKHFECMALFEAN